MRTSTLAQGPLKLGGEVITIGATIYNLEAGDNPATYPEPLKSFWDTRVLVAAAEAAIHAQENADRARMRLRSAGQAVVSVMQLRLAALSLGHLAALDARIAALADSEFKVRWQCMDLFTRADLQFLVPGTLTNAQVNGLFTAAQAQ